MSSSVALNGLRKQFHEWELVCLMHGAELSGGAEGRLEHLPAQRPPDVCFCVCVFSLAGLWVGVLMGNGPSLDHTGTGKAWWLSLSMGLP